MVDQNRKLAFDEIETINFMFCPVVFSLYITIKLLIKNGVYARNHVYFANILIKLEKYSLITDRDLKSLNKALLTENFSFRLTERE